MSWIPGFGFLGLDSWVWIPRFRFKVWIHWFGLLVIGLDSWVWITRFGFKGLDSWVRIPKFGFLGFDS